MDVTRHSSVNQHSSTQQMNTDAGPVLKKHVEKETTQIEITPDAVDIQDPPGGDNHHAPAQMKSRTVEESRTVDEWDIVEPAPGQNAQKTHPKAFPESGEPATPPAASTSST